MDEAWPNAPSSEINVNFDKSYCVGTSINKILSKTRTTGVMDQLALLECQLAHLKPCLVVAFSTLFLGHVVAC